MKDFHLYFPRMVHKQLDLFYLSLKPVNCETIVVGGGRQGGPTLPSGSENAAQVKPVNFITCWS